MAKQKMNSPDSELELGALQRELLGWTEFQKEIPVDKDVFFQYAVTLQSKARQASDNSLKGKLYAESCFYFYLAGAHGKEEATDLGRQVAGEWASRMYDPKYRNFLCAKVALTGNEATSFTAKVVAAFIEEIRESFLPDVGIGVFFVPDHVLAVFNTLRFFTFEKDSMLPSDPFSFVQDLLERVQGCEFEDAIGRDLSGFFGWAVRGNGIEPPFFEHYFGMPSETAFAVGMAYLEGKWLPHSRTMAARFLRYAVLTGSPRACLAWALFFDDLGLVVENGDGHFLSPYCGTLAHGVMLSLLQYVPTLKNSCTGIQYTTFTKDREQRVDVALMTSLGAALSAHEDKTNTCVHSVDLHMVIDMLGAMKSRAKNDENVDRCVRITATRLLSITEKDDELKDKLREFLKSHYFKKRKSIDGSTLDIAFELLEGWLGEKTHNRDVNLCLLDFRPILQDPRVVANLDDLCKENIAEAFFLRATMAWMQHGDEEQLYQAFLKAAKCGLPISLYNLSFYLVQEGKLKEARECAEKALFSGIPQAYSILYHLGANRKGKEYELACTCLRYATEYLLPGELAQTLAKLRQEGKYKPLPFMRELEKLEKEALHDPTCAALVGNMCARGLLLPADQFQAFKWYRQAVSLGDYMSVEALRALYAKDEWKGADGQEKSVLADFSQGLEAGSRYGIGIEKNLYVDPAKASSHLKKIFTALKKGNTWLERMLFVRCLREEIWNVFGIDTSAEYDNIVDPQLFYEPYTRDYLENMADCKLLDFMGIDPVLQETYKHMVNNLKLMVEHGDPRMHKLQLESKALTALRGSLPVDLIKCRELLFEAMNADCSYAKAMYKASWEILEQTGSDYDPQRALGIGDDHSTKDVGLKSDGYFDLSVEQ